MNTPHVKFTLDLSQQAGCSQQQSALLRDLTKNSSVSALLESVGADTLEIRFSTHPCEGERIYRPSLT